MTPTMMATTEELERIEPAVRKALRGDEIVLAQRLYDVATGRGGGESYREAIFMVAWQSKSRVEGRDCGTHRVHLNSKGESMLVHGNYDLNRESAMRDLADRMKNAPIKSDN